MEDKNPTKTFYIIGGNYEDLNGDSYWDIECHSAGHPYVYTHKPWAPSYSVLGHIHERYVYRLEESGDRIFAVREDDSSPAERIQLTGYEASMVRRAIETGDGLITHKL